MLLSTALVTGGAADKINIGKKPQAILLSDSDDEECQHYQPPTSKLVDVSIVSAVVLCSVLMECFFVIIMAELQ